MGTVNIGYLIPELRLNIGDTNPATYRYDNEWIRIALLAGIKRLARWWNYRYKLDSDNLVYRNSLLLFAESEPPVIMIGDERPIIVAAALVILEGSLQDNAWDLASWRDAEISYSNLEGGRVKNDVIRRLWDELREAITPPNKRLARPLKGSLPGYLNNPFERIVEDLG